MWLDSPIFQGSCRLLDGLGRVAVVAVEPRVLRCRRRSRAFTRPALFLRRFGLDLNLHGMGWQTASRFQSLHSKVGVVRAHCSLPCRRKSNRPDLKARFSCIARHCRTLRSVPGSTIEDGSECSGNPAERSPREMPEAKYTDDSRTIALLPRCRPPCQPTACRNCWAWRLRSTMRAVKFTENVC